MPYSETWAEHYPDGTVIPYMDKKAREAIGEGYNPPYSAGQAIMYEGITYVANTAIASDEIWTPAHWTASNVCAMYNELKSNLVKYLKINNVITFASGSTGSGYKTYSFSDDDACKGKTILSVHAITSSVSGSVTMMTDDRYFDSNTYGLVYRISSALPSEVKYSLVVAYI